MAEETTVLVAGAGPTGLLLASELCRRGVRCRIIDDHPGPLHWDRATIVHPRTLEVFESLGIVGSLLERGVKQRFALIQSAGKELGKIDLTICGSRYGFNVGISEEVTESILADYLRRQGGDVIRSSRLVDLTENGNRLSATIDHEGVKQSWSAEWVVGCDGYRSTVRRLCGIELIGHDHSDPWAVFDATVPGWSETFEAIFAYLDEVPVILTSLPNKRWRVYLRPSSRESDLLKDATTTLQCYWPNIRFEAVENPTRFYCHSKVATRFRKGRVLLAGDAAHVCSPSQGHGMNSGIQDAFNLAWKLALVCNGQCSDELLDSYEAERRPVAEMIAASGDAFERAQDLSDPADRRTRDEQLRAIFANPESRHHESIAEAELDIDYCDSPIVVGDLDATFSPGQRLPDTIEFRRPDGSIGLLHELAHRAGHAALLIGGQSADVKQLAKIGGSLRALSGPTLIETVAVLSNSEKRERIDGSLSRNGLDELGIHKITLLVIRPDGHVGLRADTDHCAALATYHTRLHMT